MKPPILTVDDARDPAAEQVIAEGLRRYNREQCGISDGRPARLRDVAPLHDQLPGARFLRAPRVPRPRDHSVQSAGHEPHLSNEGARVTR